MKKLIGLMIALTLVLSLCACGGQPGAEQKTENGAASGEVTQADIEKNIVGTWMLSEKDGQPALTNEKVVYLFESPTKAYVSASLNLKPEVGAHWIELLDTDVSVDGNKMTITYQLDEKTRTVNEYIITDINANEFIANRKKTITADGEEVISEELSACYVKVNDDYSKDIIGTWEGKCTSEGSVFDDGQDHRWEYKDDGTFVYYVKNGDSWVPSEDTMNEYYVAGNLLCSRWMENGQENREWLDISIDGDNMNWTALREGEDGKTYTSTFEMTKVEK